MEDFIALDYDGMTVHFTYPVMIMGSTTRILEKTEALINYSKSLISEYLRIIRTAQPKLK